jgi:hypothetical protein
MDVHEAGRDREASHIDFTPSSSCESPTDLGDSATADGDIELARRSAESVKDRTVPQNEIGLGRRAEEKGRGGHGRGC